MDGRRPSPPGLCGKHVLSVSRCCVWQWIYMTNTNVFLVQFYHECSHSTTKIYHIITLQRCLLTAQLRANVSVFNLRYWLTHLDPSGPQKHRSSTLQLTMQCTYRPVVPEYRWCMGIRCWQSPAEVLWHWQCPCSTHKHSHECMLKVSK